MTPDAAPNKDRILRMVRRQLERRNPPDTAALYGRAARIDESVRDLDLRQFNARFVLPVRREMKRTEEGEEKEGAPAAEGAPRARDDAREEVRKVFLKLARDVAAADDAELVVLIEGLARYEDAILGAAGTT